MSVTTHLAKDYVIRVNGSQELSGHLRLGDKFTFCYTPASCWLFLGRSQRFIPRQFRNTTLGVDSAMISVQLWSKCHSPRGKLDWLNWTDCNFLGIQCEEAEWCL